MGAKFVLDEAGVCAGVCPGVCAGVCPGVTAGVCPGVWAGVSPGVAELGVAAPESAGVLSVGVTGVVPPVSVSVVPSGLSTSAALCSTSLVTKHTSFLDASSLCVREKWAVMRDLKLSTIVQFLDF